MQFDFLFRQQLVGQPAAGYLHVGAQPVPIQFVRNHRARRYIIRVQPDGTIRATVPRVGSVKAARAFAERNIDWIARQLQHRPAQPPQSTPWHHGTELLYRGEKAQLRVNPNPTGLVVQFGDQTLPAAHTANLRPTVERHLRKLATVELPAQTVALAKMHGLIVQRITIRNQRSRWGSCSHRGTISLNWRLIQMPAFVQNYIIVHELTHLRQMNHSHQFWCEVAARCPDYRAAKVWIRRNRGLLR